MILKKLLSLLLIVSLLLLSSCSQSSQNEDKSGTEARRATIDDIPQTSTIPPYSKWTVDPNSKYGALCCIFDYNEALDMYNKLKERGVNFYNDYTFFAYEDDEVFMTYNFVGEMTEESYLTREGKEFYELEFKKNKVNVKFFLCHKERFNEMKGRGDLTDTYVVTGEVRSSDISEEIAENFRFSELYLSQVIFYEGEYICHFTYGNERIAVFYSKLPIPDDFMEKIKDTYVILRRNRNE